MLMHHNHMLTHSHRDSRAQVWPVFLASEHNQARSLFSSSVPVHPAKTLAVAMSKWSRPAIEGLLDCMGYMVYSHDLGVCFSYGLDWHGINTPYGFTDSSLNPHPPTSMGGLCSIAIRCLHVSVQVCSKDSAPTLNREPSNIPFLPTVPFTAHH